MFFLQPTFYVHITIGPTPWSQFYSSYVVVMPRALRIVFQGFFCMLFERKNVKY